MNIINFLYLSFSFTSQMIGNQLRFQSLWSHDRLHLFRCDLFTDSVFHIFTESLIKKISFLRRCLSCCINLVTCKRTYFELFNALWYTIFAPEFSRLGDGHVISLKCIYCDKRVPYSPHLKTIAKTEITTPGSVY